MVCSCKLESLAGTSCPTPLTAQLTIQVIHSSTMHVLQKPRTASNTTLHVVRELTNSLEAHHERDGTAQPVRLCSVICCQHHPGCLHFESCQHLHYFRWVRMLGSHHFAEKIDA